MEDGNKVSPVDVQANLDYLTDMLTIHFKNLRDADSCFGHDHAQILKDHISRMATEKPKGNGGSDFMDSKQVMRLPRAISRFAPRATVNPALNWGLFGRLPRELRDIIYNAVFLSHDCSPSTYIEACTCTQESRRSQSGLALLRTCAKIHNEALPLIYALETFALIVGVPATTTALENGPLPEWQDPHLYRETLLGQQIINRLPHHAFRLIQNLSLTFTTEAAMWTNEKLPLGMADQLLQQVSEDMKCLCALLRDEAVNLQHLDVIISIYFPWNSQTNDDDEHQDRNAVVYQLLEPLLQLRGIADTTITLRGFEAPGDGRASDALHPQSPEPRWGLTNDFMAYLGSVLASAGDTNIPGFAEGNVEGVELLEDDYEYEELTDEYSWREDEELMMRKYLRDVYGTEDLEALHGGMPDRWRVWLGSDHDEGCDWFDPEDEEEDDASSL